MHFSESKQTHEIILKAIIESKENLDPLYNIEDGRVFRRVLLNLGKLTEYTCGNDIALKLVLKAINDYCNYNINADYSFDKENKLIMALFDSFDDYMKKWENETADIDKATQMRFDRNYTEDDTMNTDKTGMKLIAIKDLEYNSKGYVLKLNYCFDYFLTGTGEAPDETKDTICYGTGSRNTAYTDEILEMPCFSHLPIPEDITDAIVEKLKGFEGFRKICIRDYRKILSMLHDNDDGTVWVKIYKDENGTLSPIYVKLFKSYVYMKWVLYHRHENIWTGFIKEAFDEAGIDYTGLSNNEFARLCFGEEYDVDGIEEPIKDESYYMTHFNEKSSTEYARFAYEIYLEMMATTSFHIALENEFYDLGIATKRLLMISPTLIDIPKEFIRDVMDTIKQTSDTYIKAYSDNKDKRHQKRIDICYSLDILYKIYCADGADSMKPFTLTRKKKQ